MFIDNLTYLNFRITAHAIREEEDKKLLKEVEQMSREVEPISMSYSIDGWFRNRNKRKENKLDE